MIILKNYNNELIKELCKNTHISGNNIVKLAGIRLISLFIKRPLQKKINNQFKQRSDLVKNSVSNFLNITTSIPFLVSIYLCHKHPDGSSKNIY